MASVPAPNLNSKMPRIKAKRDLKVAEEKIKVFGAAIEAVKGGQSIRNAAKEFGIPYSTLQEHCSGRVFTKQSPQ